MTAADYGELNPSAVLTFTDSVSVACTNIQIVDDPLVEPTESFTVSLGTNEIQVIVDNTNNMDTAQVFIADNDGKLDPSIHHTCNVNYNIIKC